MAEAIDRYSSALAGRYEIQRPLGRGGNATVYLARDTRHSRFVAVKVLNDELSHGVAADRFLSEITIAAQLVHPHILPVFDSGGDSDCLFYVMPYIDGETLRARLQREGKLSVDDAVRIAAEIGGALAYAHARGVVHRDIKPENVLLSQGHAIIADFGIARAIQQAGGERITTIGLTVGTPLYMSPEQARGERDVDGRSDVFSLGCVLYEMVSGRAPHAADTPQNVIARKFAEANVSLDDLGADVPSNVIEALRGALARDLDERFDTAEAFVATLTTPAPALVTPVSPAPRDRRGRAAMALALGVVLLVAALSFPRLRYLTRPAPADASVGLAVFPFHATDAGAAQWEEAIPDLLATALDGVPGITVADPWSVWRSLRPDPHAHARSPAPEEAAKLAQAARANYFILGSIAELERRDLQVNIRVYRRGSSEPWQTFGVTGSADSLSTLLRRVSLETIRRLSLGGAPNAAMRVDQGLTSSPDALKAWLVARESRRRGQLDSADAAIDRALSLDSSFVLAMIDAVTIKSLVQFSRGQQYAGLRDLAERAVRMSDRVPERAALHARAMLASINTDGATAAAAMNRVLSIDSTDFDAWSLLGYVQMAYGWQYGQGARDATASAERAVRLDPTDAPSLTRRAYLAIVEDDPADVRRQTERMRAADTSSALVRGMLLGVDALGLDDKAFAARVPALAGAALPDWISVLRILRIYRPERADALLERTRTLTSPVARIATTATIQLAGAQGRWRALDSLRGAGTFGVGADVDRNVDRMIVAAAIGGAGDDQLARRSVAKLAAELPPDSALAQFTRRSVWHDGWLIAAFNAMYGDTIVARAWQLAIGTLPTKDAHPVRYTVALRDDIASRLASRRGDRASALFYAQRAFDAWDVHTENQPEVMPEPAMRFQLATLLRASGSADSAMALFRSLTPPTTWMGFYTARASLELGELSEEARDLGTAQRAYLTASRMWERGDSSVASLRERARKGLARIAEGGRR